MNNTSFAYPIPRNTRPMEGDPPDMTRTQRMVTLKPIHPAIVILEHASSTVIPAVGGLLMAAASQSEMGVIIGSAIAGAGIAGVLGMMLGDVIPELSIPNLKGMRRLGVNWLTGICSIPFASSVHRKWFPEEEIGIVSAGLAGISAFLGVSILMILIPLAFRKVKDKATGWSGPPARMDEKDKIVINVPPMQPPTVRLPPPEKPPQ